MSNRLQVRTINSVVGHLIAECYLDHNESLIRDPRNNFKPIAFVPASDKATVLKAIRRVGQILKLQKNLALLGITILSGEVFPVNQEKIAEFAKRSETAVSVKNELEEIEDALPLDEEEEEPKEAPIVIPTKGAKAPVAAKVAAAPMVQISAEEYARLKKGAPAAPPTKRTTIVRKAKR